MAHIRIRYFVSVNKEELSERRNRNIEINKGVTMKNIGSTNFSFDKQKWIVAIARYIFYVLFIRGSKELVTLGYKMLSLKQNPDPRLLVQAYQTYLYIFTAVAAILFYNNERIFGEEFLMLFVAYLVTKYLEMEQAPTSIRYGIGMACSFFEGYLTHVIPSDGANFVGFEENIRKYEATDGIVFPVKVLFIIITKSMYCPPVLTQFNKPNAEGVMSYLEACKSLEDVTKSVAGVNNRIYRNSAYKIHRAARAPVYLAAECATPLHTLHKVLQRRALYAELKNIDIEEVVRDFCYMLRSIIAKSEECRGKCELVYFDNTNPDLNLADVLLDKIREMEPNFENVQQN
ncbi:uncharacterized protein LOC128675196 isoform X2 [Plodia interpunctella]|uniref:uncharacterized protein LOC128675196 isoform X2 n=1 Tax=Plodia interpunctella TaxID=58824 RepID=UPI0023682788|nr:uncharacterized protein LOC128675196 isoform X2 [Plodia interpunctella]